MHRLLLVLTGFCTSLVFALLLCLNVRTAFADPQAEQVWIQEEHRTETTVCVQEQLQFPYMIEGSNLVLERVVAYDGPFVEDGTNREVFGVTAIVLRNAGVNGVVQAKVTLQQQERVLYFETNTLPPGQTVLVIEKNKSEYIQEIFISCDAEQTVSDTQWWLKNPPLLEPVGMGSLNVYNPYDVPLDNLWLYYKTYQPDPGLYLGGITYKVGIRRLDPGQSLQINPPNYANGYSRIVRIITE